MDYMHKDLWKKLIAAVFALAVWQTASMLVGHEILLASPVSVLRTLFSIVSESSFRAIVGTSSLRIITGFLAAYAAGLILGIVSARFEWIRTLLWPFMICIKTVPVASFIVLSLIWLSSGQLTSFVSFLACLPSVYNNVSEGISSVDRGQKEAAQMLGAGWLRTIRAVVIPNISTYLTAAASTACGTAFKAGAAAEVVAVVSGSIGEQIYMSKGYFETARLFAWTLVIVLLSFVFEKAFCLLLRKAIGLCSGRH